MIYSLKHIHLPILLNAFLCLAPFVVHSQNCLGNPITHSGVSITNTERADLGLGINAMSLNRALLTVTLTVSNAHHTVGSTAGKVISFYDGDPTLTNPRSIAQYVVTGAISAGQTSQFSTQLDLSALPVMPFYLYAVLGDDGTTSKPYTMNDLGAGPSGSDECFFTNNLARFSSMVPLPIELLDFSVESLSEDDFEFRWQTATEHDNMGFHLELARGTAGQHSFESVAFVRGQGSSQSATSYNHVLNDLRPGQYYARLRQVDFSGGHSYSDVVSFKVEGSAPWAYPTVLGADGSVNIYLPFSGDWGAKLHDSEGRLVRTMEWRLGDGEGKTLSMPAEMLPPGFYYLLIEERAAGERWTEKLVVVRR